MTPLRSKDQELGDGTPSGRKPRQSRLPQEDEAASRQYDQPWEWKRKTISPKAFAGDSLTLISEDLCPSVFCSG